VTSPTKEIDLDRIAGVLFAQRAALVMLMKTVETLASAKPGLFERIADSALNDLRASATGPSVHAVREFEKIMALIGPPQFPLWEICRHDERGATILPFPGIEHPLPYSSSDPA
jgi:hypothetical protein